MTSPEVTIEQGTLRGSTSTDLRGEAFFKFQGIPYAKPPLADLRFKAPRPPEKWTGTYDATKHRDVSYHRDPLQGGAILGSENCLFINVYTKKIPSGGDKNLRPVLVWVHGGAFFFGSGNEELYGPDFLMTEDVVVVTFNYRLGLLGFISFEDPSVGVPGNAGFKDQVMALKWVQKNISKFGGDPSNVTIFGESAGGASVHLLVLSSLTKGLFHKAIAQSGCALNPWVRGSKGSEPVATAMNLEGADDRTVYKNLIEKSVEEIIEIQNELNKNLIPGQSRTIGFVIEEKSPEAFLDEEPDKIIASGKFNQVPFMLGYTTGEGMIFDLLKRGPINFKDVIPLYFGYAADEKEAVAGKIKNFYYGGEKVSEDNKYDMLSDCQFIYGIHVTTRSHLPASKAPIYLYRMSVETELNFFKKFMRIQTPGVSHLDDVGYLFKTFATPEIASGSVEDIALSRFVKLWTNFARFANPTPDPKDDLLKATWKPVSNENLDFLDIGRKLVPMVNPDIERVNFWKKIFAESPAGQVADSCCLRPNK